MPGNLKETTRRARGAFSERDARERPALSTLTVKLGHASDTGTPPRARAFGVVCGRAVVGAGLGWCWLGRFGWLGSLGRVAGRFGGWMVEWMLGWGVG